MSAELILAVVAAADLCLKYGKRLVGLYQDFKNADESVKEKILIVEAIWSRTATQIDFVKRITRTLDKEHCRVQFEVLEMLRSKLIIAVTKFESISKKPPDNGVKKWKLFLVREGLDETISQLQLWHRLFDPSWYLMLRIDDKLVDVELATELQSSSVSGSSLPGCSTDTPITNLGHTLTAAQSLRNVLKSAPDTNIHISLLQNGLDWDNATSIPFSTTRLVRRTGSSKTYLVDTILCDSNLDVPAARADTEDLVKKLSQADTAVFGLLACYGLVKRKDLETRRLASLDLVFCIPTEDVPMTLRKRLMQPSTFSLTDILNVARQLARAVSFVHACDFVHKNIRPETILLFPSDGTLGNSKLLGDAYVLGFDSFRSVNFHTLLRGDVAWERNLYRHPSRQGVRAQDKYAMQHDLYSLGVCLLELGLWVSFVEYEADDGAIEASPSEALGLKVNDFKQETLGSKPFTLVKDHLVLLAQSKLPMRMGDKYTSVVVNCLTCLDEGNTDFGGESELQDEDGILIGLKFIEKVLFRLSEISF